LEANSSPEKKTAKQLAKEPAMERAEQQVAQPPEPLAQR
jgi:hypothetical protein